jgi:glycosyltransferase involved in cell wall biosynthesis
MQPTKKNRIAFLFPAFPILHQTFVLWEVKALLDLGVPIEIYSIKPPEAGAQQPEGEALKKDVHYLPSPFSVPVLRANLTMLLRQPRRYLGAYAGLVLEWWKDRGPEIRRRKSAKADPGEQLLSRRERLEGYLNTSPLVYLLRSIALVPQAVYLGAELRAKGIERVHSHWATYSTTIALVLKWVYDIPFSFTAHAYDIYLAPLLLPVKLRDAEFAVTCAQVNAQYMGQLAGAGVQDRIVVNYHGVNLERFRPRPPAARGELPCLVTCGGLRLYKGHHVLLRACAEMQTPVRCVIIGSGPQRPVLEKLADSLGIAGRVELTGALPQEEVAERYSQADLFVLASIIVERFGRQDVIPNVLVEAMAMRLPVVATAIPGIRELFEDGKAGRLVPPNDSQALAAALDELLADETERRRLAEAGYRKVTADFDRSVNIKDLAALLVEGPNRGSLTSLRTG